MPTVMQVAVPGETGVRRFDQSVRVGRADTNGIVLNNDLVSAEHLDLLKTDEGWEIVDLGSTNGTFIDGVRVVRARAGAATTVRLGPGGPELHLTIPGHAPRRGTRKVEPGEIAERYLRDSAPEGMSWHTAMIRAAFRERREEETNSWLARIRRLRVAVGLLLVISAGAGGIAIWQARRVHALREAAGAVFSTMKSLELDVRRLEATSKPDSSIQRRRARLEAQYEQLVRTLGIYSSRTPADVQLIYRTVHRLGESEATMPRGFVDEVRRYVKRWQPDDLKAAMARAAAQNLGPQVSAILLQHHLPGEFFYLAMQESRLDPRAVGPSTRFGIPKGMWQLIPPTAEAYGLRLGPLRGVRQFDPLDERHDVTKAATAAARYVEDMFTTDAQASGLLVIASYNMGEPRIRSLIRSMPESPAQRNFWALLEQHRSQIPAETYDYVFRVIAAAVIGANPKLFGFDFDPPLGVQPAISPDTGAGRG
jgi:membrane-bound lytic murein transglycosylase D